MILLLCQIEACMINHILSNMNFKRFQPAHPKFLFKLSKSINSNIDICVNFVQIIVCFLFQWRSTRSETWDTSATIWHPKSRTITRLHRINIHIRGWGGMSQLSHCCKYLQIPLSSYGVSLCSGLSLETMFRIFIDNIFSGFHTIRERMFIVMIFHLVKFLL